MKAPPSGATPRSRRRGRAAPSPAEARGASGVIYGRSRADAPTKVTRPREPCPVGSILVVARDDDARLPDARQRLERALHEPAQAR